MRAPIRSNSQESSLSCIELQHSLAGRSRQIALRQASDLGSGFETHLSTKGEERAI